jgi:GNAT superfamily N-acetyltransferase
MQHFERARDSFTVSTDPRRVDVDAVHAYLRDSYWAKNIPRQIVERAILNSLCFALLEHDRQIGFARVISDKATFAYLCDVYVIDERRGRGLGKWLIEQVQSHPDLQGLRNFLLRTRDAHALYASRGWTAPANPSSYMEISRPGMYAREKPGELKE